MDTGSLSPKVSRLPENEALEGWDAVYAAKGSTGVSWYQSSPSHSLEWIDALAPDPSSLLIDVGAGASTLVDALLRRGYRTITLLDQSRIALAMTRGRLQADPILARRSSGIHWIQGDLLDAVLPHHGFDLWHDRAVFTSSLSDHKFSVIARNSETRCVRVVI